MAFNILTYAAPASVDALHEAFQTKVVFVGPVMNLVKPAVVLDKIPVSHALQLTSMSSILPFAYRHVPMDTLRVSSTLLIGKRSLINDDFM